MIIVNQISFEEIISKSVRPKAEEFGFNADLYQNRLVFYVIFTIKQCC